ncbi:MAG: TlpA family protein disulfide reductase [Marinifilaceae bacterium]|jgi:peroxiredoxin|nr:TlpA family protein disulfide reductase [Marinifilaceae bacterium]
MKHILFILLGLSFIGCSSEKDNNLILTGNTYDTNQNIAKLITPDSVFIDTIKNNCFSFKIQINKEKYASLKLGKQTQLYIKPQDSIHIEILKDSIIYSGKGYEESKYIYHKEKLLQGLGIHKSKRIDIKLYSSKLEDFRESIHKTKEIRTDHINNYNRKNHKLSNNFVLIEKERINYQLINQLFSYPDFHKTLTKAESKIPDNYYEFINNVKLNDKRLYSFIEYKLAINSLLNYNCKNFKSKYQFAKTNITDKDFLEDILYVNFHKYINKNGTDEIETIFNEFIQNIKDKKKSKILKTKYNSWKSLNKGQKASDFQLTDDTNKTIRLSDFRGKYIYIDCWSYHCGPCIANLDSFNKLRKDYSNKNIVFITISMDSDKNKWKTKLKEYKLNGINLNAGEKNNSFKTNYNIKYLPRYILIDPNGLIIDATADDPNLIGQYLDESIS